MRARLGGGPLHLLGHLVVIAIAAIALSKAFDARFAPQPLNLAGWLIGGALLHDMVFLPAYGLLDRGGRRLLGRDVQRAVPLVNHVRVPLVLAGVFLLVWFPRILDEQDINYVHALGHEPPDYLGRWVAVTGGLFAASAITYLARVAAARRSSP